MSSSEIQSVIQQMRALAARSGIEAPELGEGPGQTVGGVRFADELGKAMNQVNDLQTQATGLQDRFIQGDPGIGLAEVMSAGQKADVAFRVALEVRNRCIAAYEEIMRMQV